MDADKSKTYPALIVAAVASLIVLDAELVARQTDDTQLASSVMDRARSLLHRSTPEVPRARRTHARLRQRIDRHSRQILDYLQGGFVMTESSPDPSPTLLRFDHARAIDKHAADLLGQAISGVREVTLELLTHDEPFKETTAALRELIAGLHATFQSHDQKTAAARQAILVLNEMHARLVDALGSVETPADAAEAPDTPSE